MKIMILGGNLTNLGAQAMVYTVISELSERIPNAKFWLMSTETISHVDTADYKFEIWPWRFSTLVKSVLPTLKTIGLNSAKDVSDLKELLSEVDAIIDISGFALSSQFKIYRTLKYLLNLYVAKFFDIPVYLLPQSFGPFNYKFPLNALLILSMRWLLRYPKKIYARENEGLKYLNSLSLRNLELHRDIVLTRSRQVNSNLIYKKPKTFASKIMEVDGVGVIPNKMAVSKNYDIVDLYCAAILKVPASSNVTLVVHSHDDRELCDKIHVRVSQFRDIDILDAQLDAIQMSELISKFDYLIASRYHSIVHGYVVGVPAVIIGWAVKYHELAKIFNQQDFVFDARDNVDFNKLEASVELMSQEFEERSAQINVAHASLKDATKVFSKIALDLTNEA